ncbi:MAG: DUF3857 domain-containing protein [Dysgonomonas sp.]|nr:DUF3857 domain-containing protein [Dysgonomonas sp.]
MKKKHIIIIILFLHFAICAKGYAQENYSFDYGKVTQYEMSMTEYEKDPLAEALVIYEKGEYYFQGDDIRGMLLYMDKTIKVKILKQAGVKYAEFEIPYYEEGRDWERIEKIEATTYNWDNNQLIKTTLESKNIFEEKINNNVRVKKIALANVREGSVIEFKYKISTPYYFNMRKWEFQKKIPVVYSQLLYRAIPYYEYAYILKGTNKLDGFNSSVLNNEIRWGQLVYKEMLYDFVLKDIPAFRDEEYISSVQDHIISLNFQMAKYYMPSGGSREIITTWPAMCDDFLKNEDFGKYIKNSEKEAKNILPQLNLTDKKILEQAELITEHVKNNYNWNGINSKYATGKLSDFLKKRTGNAADINLFLLGLLKAANIEAYPVVLSTKGNGTIDENHPFQQFLNYVIVQVMIDGKPYFIDATESLLYFNELPERCINIGGLVVKPKLKKEEWVMIQQSGLSLTQLNFNLDILPLENKVKAKAQSLSTKYNAYNYRAIHLGKNENISKYLKSKYNINVLDDIKVTPMPKLNRPFIFSYNFEQEIDNLGDKIFIHPFCNHSIKDNPFKQTIRNRPVDLVHVRGEILQSSIKIPNGYKVEYLPKRLNIENDIIQIIYEAEEMEQHIEVKASYTFRKNIYGPQEYENLKMNMAEVIKQFSEMIVLVKK